MRACSAAGSDSARSGSAPTSSVTSRSTSSSASCSTLRLGRLGLRELGRLSCRPLGNPYHPLVLLLELDVVHLDTLRLLNALGLVDGTLLLLCVDAGHRLDLGRGVHGACDVEWLALLALDPLVDVDVD